MKLIVQNIKSILVCLILVQAFFFISFAQTTSQLSSSDFTLAEQRCIEEKLSISAGIDGYLYSNYNFREEFYTIDEEASFYLEKLVKILASKNIKLVKVTPLLKSITEKEYLSKEHPKHTAFLVDENLEHYHIHLAKLQELGIEAPNFHTIYAENNSEEDFYIDYDSHWSILGSRLAALAVGETIKLSSVYDGLDKVAFRTIVKGEYEFHGVRKALSKRCDVEIKPYKSKNLFTELDIADEEKMSMQLFGEESYPVVVIGTSFSLKPFNFAGFLSQVLSLKVLNWSQPNARLEGSILSFFVSDNYRDSPPKFLVWESANYAFANSVKQLRQIIPAAIGGCKPADVLHNVTLNIQTGSTPEVYVLFDNLENIVANNHFLELSYVKKTDNSKIDIIRIYSQYADADTDIKFLDHGFFDDYQKIFYLFNHYPYDLTSVSIGSLPQNIDVTLEAKICPLTY